MKNQIVYPPKIAFSISDDFYNLLFKKLGDCNSELLPWIAMSLLHSSYINEHKSNVHRNFITTLGSLGASFMQLTLFDIANESNSLKTLHDYDEFAHGLQGKIMEVVFDEFNLEKIMLVGKGAVKSPNLKWIIGKQFFGSLLICYGYDVLRPLVYQITQEISSKQDILDYKTMLQEYSQLKKMGRPIYEIIQESGPDHNKIFTTKVSTVDGKFIHGEGKSKHEAAKKAALEYIKKFAPALLANKTSHLQKNMIKANTSPLFIHKDFVLSLCKMFNVEREKAWAFSQSLTHPSFVNETATRQVADYGKHAQLGANVLEAFFTQQISFLALENLDIDEITIEQYRSFLNSEDFSRAGFDLLNLQNGVLLVLQRKVESEKL